MTARSIQRERAAIWRDLFFDLGYREIEPDWPGHHRQSLVLAAVKRDDYGDKPVKITVDEVWLAGVDPDDLAPSTHGCFLLYSSWNATFETGATGHERRDLDRSHVGEEIHAHPLGEPNHRRIVLPALGTPEDWMLATVERLIADRRGF